MQQTLEHGITVDEATHLADQTSSVKYSPWTPHMFRLYGVLLCAYFCACLNGYDGSVMGGLNAMTSYQKYFNMKSASASTGFVFAIYNVGVICAIPFVGPTNDYFGRRAGMFIGSIIVLAGACVIGSSSTHAAFLAGRFVLGFGVAFCNVSAPIYVGEIAHPVWRGTMMGVYNSFWSVGSIVASWVVYAAARMEGRQVWRIPLYCQLISASIVAIFVWTLPESPRWLIANGRNETARNVLAEYHGEGDRDHPLVKLEMAEMENMISTEASDKKWWDYRELLNTRAARRRMFCVVTMAAFAQWCGNSVTNYYMPVMLENAGITSQSKKLMLNAIYPVITFLATLIGAWFMDKFGRRRLLMTSLVFCIICFSIITPTSKLAAENPSKSTAANTSIAFIYLFGISYSVGWSPLSPMYIVECLETSTRAKGKSVAQFVTALASFVIQYSSGPAFEHIKYYFYIVFIGWDCIEFVVIYLFWPETNGRTLEELDEVFKARNPVKKSLEPKNVQTIINAADAQKTVAN
ncbi:general substrate transporter [Lindgomyces ingoldianus]|uniref:General substrate transporter n=1 Tax=Lindgomyces ingoldianus TaxID=673940 RepID=A0ACB6QKL5_9PLEO|nr:general substrate transporter [Lindgomyces ingoldianus]KAF2466657.1 general substrate transporter [Lindgomyces ingoldianus]